MKKTNRIRVFMKTQMRMRMMLILTKVILMTTKSPRNIKSSLILRAEQEKTWTSQMKLTHLWTSLQEIGLIDTEVSKVLRTAIGTHMRIYQPNTQRYGGSRTSTKTIRIHYNK